MATLADIQTQLTTQSSALDMLATDVAALKAATGPSDQTAIDAVGALVSTNQNKLDAIVAAASA